MQLPLTKGALTPTFRTPFQPHREARRVIFDIFCLNGTHGRYGRCGWHFSGRSHRTYREQKAHGRCVWTHGTCSKCYTVPRVVWGDEDGHEGDWQISLYSMSDCIFILRGAETLILHLYSWWFEVFRGMIKIYESWLEILFITHFFLLTCELLSQLYLLWEPLLTFYFR